MKRFIIVITYKNGNVKNQHLYGTIEQASNVIQTYSSISSIESVYLKYK